MKVDNLPTQWKFLLYWSFGTLIDYGFVRYNETTIVGSITMGFVIATILTLYSNLKEKRKTDKN